MCRNPYEIQVNTKKDVREFSSKAKKYGRNPYEIQVNTKPCGLRTGQGERVVIPMRFRSIQSC